MRLHNTLTRQVEELVPRRPGTLSAYVCGPTVQGAPHFGHALAALVPDVLRRWLEHQGTEVFLVRNVTDVDDKIIAQAQQEGVFAAEVAERCGRLFDDVFRRLRIAPPRVEPRATAHIDPMIELVEQLERVGSAYRTGGDVWFRVRSFPEYGRLSGRDLDELRSGARVDADDRKEDPLDFALWKAAKPGEPSWRSPWGRGRPGWHLECSAMSATYLGTGFDLHAGGADLIFPHHENEIAQSEAATGERFARHWLHNGHLTMGGEKMSKSVGNVVSLTEALDRHGPDVIRFLFLSAHYRSPIELSDERLDEARAGLERLRAFHRATAPLDAAPTPTSEVLAQREAFAAAMDDDLATPRAHAALFELVRAGHAAREAGEDGVAVAARDAVTELAGALGYDLAAEESGGSGALVGGLIELLLSLRAEARAARDFATADRVRDRLAELGVTVEDHPDGARWHLR